MAHLLFSDTLSGGVPTAIDPQTVLAVQSLLSSTANTGSHESGVATTTTAVEVADTDDGDIFQCGKCKKQFTSLLSFIEHKKVPCSLPNRGSRTSNSENTQIISLSTSNIGCSALLPQTQIQLPASPLPSVTDLLSISANIDQAITSITAEPALQTTAITTTSSLVPQGNAPDPCGNSPLTSTVSAIPATAATSSGQPDPQLQLQSVGFSFLGNTFVSAPLLVSSQHSPTTIPSATVIDVNGTSYHIENTVETTAISDSTLNSQAAKTVELVSSSEELQTQTITLPTSDKQTTPQKNIIEPVNVIEEFSTSMVKLTKTKKPSSNNNSNPDNKKNKLKCSYCNKPFNKNFDLQQHIRVHTGEKPFQCIVCGRAFAQKSNVKKHMLTHKVWPDGLANTIPTTHNTSKDQTPDTSGKEDTNEEPAQCSQKQKSDQGSSDSQDQSSFHMYKNYACPYCTFIVKNYYELKSHMKQHKREKLFKCIVPRCGQMFTELEPYLEHVKTHDSDMYYRCHICNKNFQTLRDLGVHQYAHSLYPNQRVKSGPMLFRCTRCQNRYATPTALEHHMQTSTHYYRCPVCNKVFPSERYLRRHLNIHGTSDNHTCTVCKKVFKNSYYLKAHLMIHSGEKPYKCNQCNARFNRPDKLKRHKLVHDPVKRFKCPFRSYTGCPREFNRADKLKAHIISHSGIKPYTCKVCNRMFTRRTNLRDHEKMHCDFTETFPFPCMTCSQRFQSEEKLQQHVCPSLKSKNKKKGQKSAKKSKTKNGGDSAAVNPNDSGAKQQKFKKMEVKTSEQLAFGDLNSEMLDDDIPTAHIEIITDVKCTNDRDQPIAHYPLPSVLMGVQLHQIEPIIPTSDGSDAGSIMVIDTGNEIAVMNDKVVQNHHETIVTNTDVVTTSGISYANCATNSNNAVAINIPVNERNFVPSSVEIGETIHI